jgi:AraC family transcriptional regulator of adaptative response/methylated-DNA-[protein]-cysteine methyltransferase
LAQHLRGQGRQLNWYVIFEGRYESHSGFRDAFGKVFGKPPGKSSSDAVLTYDGITARPLRRSNIKGICLVEFTDRRCLNIR